MNQPRFHKINIEVSNVCNLKCSFCPEVVRERAIMSVPLFEKVLEQAAPLTELVCLHLLGDPLVHPKLGELVQVCKRHQAKIFLVTNGVLLREKQAELLLDPVFYQVNFSLHSFGDNFPEQDPGDYLKKIFDWTELALLKRPELYINFRLWNLEDARGSLAPNQKVLKEMEFRFGFSLKDSWNVKRGKSLRLQGRLYLHFDTEFVWPSTELPVLGTEGTCYGLKSHIGVLADGTVVPCCLDHQGAIQLGSLKTDSLMNILNSPRARAMRLGFDRGELVEPLCQRCQYIERFHERPKKIETPNPMLITTPSNK